MRFPRLARNALGSLIAFSSAGCGAPALAAEPPKDAKDKGAEAKKDHVDPDPSLPHHFANEEKITTGHVTVGKQRIDYRAVAGTLVVHARGWDDVAARLDLEDKEKGGKEGEGKHGGLTSPEASIFYAAYFKQGVPAESRPVTFFFNGGPGSSTVWLHMGAFGPRRVATPSDRHLQAAPYPLVENAQSLLDATDMVFIDAPGAGFSRIAGPDKEKAFWGVDADAHAFAEFIVTFLARYGRYNSPKYLFGESYGTTRAAVLINELETNRLVDFNGVIMLSQALDFELLPDLPEQVPGMDIAYELMIPTFAATAAYHHKLGPDVPPDLKALTEEAAHFAMTEYALALQQGSALPEAERARVAGRLHAFTGLPVEYIRKANLRVTGGDFEKALRDSGDESTGRLDTRFAGPAMDPLEKNPSYDPFTASVGSTYVSAFNDYVRRELQFGEDRAFRPFAPIDGHWSFEHSAPGAGGPQFGTGLNVLGDLASAMKYNPNLKVLLNAGYYDLATPFYEGIYEMHHLPMPDRLQANIEYAFYESGHMIYANEASLKVLHDNVADFIRRASATPPARR
ncbi:MAG: peptidase S10 [Polyangiaceae bacterium]|jgi:carboxypeptidase C (cathepsin A)